jgi:hypothetical protein
MHAARVTGYSEPVTELNGGLGTELNNGLSSGLNGGLNGGLESGLSSGLEFASSFSLDNPNAVDSRKRILMLSVSAGNGHVRAAEALVAHARADFPAISVRHQDVLQLVPRLTKAVAKASSPLTPPHAKQMMRYPPRKQLHRPGKPNQ